MTRLKYGGPDGHGRYGLLDHDEQGLLICHECGQSYRQLATHVAGRHGIAPAAYRAAHGLSPGVRLVAEQTRQALREAFARHAELHLAALDASRDAAAANRASLRDTRWAPGRIAARQQLMAARRVELTDEQLAELGDATDIVGWCDRARMLMARDGVPAAAIARATGLATATVSQRLRRHPPRT